MESKGNEYGGGEEGRERVKEKGEIKEGIEERE